MCGRSVAACATCMLLVFSYLLRFLRSSVGCCQTVVYRLGKALTACLACSRYVCSRDTAATNEPTNRPCNKPKRLQQGAQAELYSAGGSRYVLGRSALVGLSKLVGLPTLPAHEEGVRRDKVEGKPKKWVGRKAKDPRTPGLLSRRFTQRSAGDHLGLLSKYD